MLRAPLNQRNVQAQRQQGGLQQALAAPMLTGAPRESKIGWLHSEDPTGYMEAARQFNEDLLKVPGLHSSRSTFLGDPADAPSGLGNTEYSAGAYVDPWTGKVLRGGTLDFLQNTDVDMTGGGEGSQTTRVDVVSPWERAYKQGMRGEEVSADDLFAMIPENERGAWQQRYNDLQSKRGTFEEQLLPTALREQIGQFVPQGKSSAFTSGEDHATNVLTANLASRGIRDLNQVGVTRDANGQQVFFDKATGTPLNSAIHTFKGGSNDGNLSYGLAVNPQGQVYITNKFKKPEKTLMDDYMPMLALAAATAVTGGALGGAMAGAGGAAGGAAGGTTGAAMGSTAGNALGYGLAGGASSAMQGGDFMGGFLTGALGGGLSHGVGQFMKAYNPGATLFTNPTYAGVANNAIRGGLTSAGQAAFRGQNPFEAGLYGLVGGGMNSGLSQYGQSLGLSPTLANQAAGFGTKYLMNQMRPRKT